MTNDTKKFMRAVERRLGKCIELHMRAGGHDEQTIQAMRYEDQLMEFIQAKVEMLEKAALDSFGRGCDSAAMHIKALTPRG